MVRWQVGAGAPCPDIAMAFVQAVLVTPGSVHEEARDTWLNNCFRTLVHHSNAVGQCCHGACHAP